MSWREVNSNWGFGFFFINTLNVEFGHGMAFVDVIIKLVLPVVFLIASRIVTFEWSIDTINSNDGYFILKCLFSWSLMFPLVAKTLSH